jgi:hypothetical protein
MVLALIVPAMVDYLQSEAKWSVKQGQNSNAFQLAEAAVGRGYQKVTESTTTWKAVQDGQPQTGYRFDIAYNDLPGGSYAISVTSGPNTREVTIIGVGRDRNQKEVRALHVVYGNPGLSNIGIMAANGVTMSGNNVNVEWGAIVSPKTIAIGSKLHPSYWSSGSIDKDTNGATPPNNDANNWWWHSYNSQIPPMPAIDFGSYKSSAQASGVSPCGISYYTVGNVSGACSDPSGKTFYITGNWTSFRGGIRGNVIVLGNMDYHNGSGTTLPAYNARIPADAWKQYCNDWSYYRTTYDGSVPATPACFGSLSNGYRPTTLTYSLSPMVHGFMYVGGDLSIPNGGGNDDILHGVIVVNGIADINTNSHGHIYYDADISMNLLTTTITLIRLSWKDIVIPWPL